MISKKEMKERLEKNREYLRKREEKKKKEIELFSGNLEEYERLKGHKYEIIDVRGNTKYLIGGLKTIIEKKEKSTFWEQITSRDVIFHTYNEIIERALMLGADALIRYEVTNQFMLRYEERGIPVKRKNERTDN